ncbi:MAG TPA: hypothetical protein VFP93_01175 [Gammaproteobacteria bacterium]|nr:hypothetical protein [Gammaproteobacteria bacterium]
MTSLKIDLPDDVYTDLTEVAKRLKQTPEETTQMALSLLMQFESLDYALVAMQRVEDGQETVPLPALAEESELSLEFHPEALDELQTLDEEDQVTVLTELIERIVAEEDELEDTLDLVINENSAEQIVLSSFEFGDIIYRIANKVTVYMIALPTQEEFEAEDISEDEDEEEDEELH